MQIILGGFISAFVRGNKTKIHGGHIMFNFTKKIDIPFVKDSIMTALNPKNYTCPIIFSDICDVSQSLTAPKFFNSFVSLILANYSKELWNQNSKIFKAKSLVFDMGMNCWEFTTCQKVVGESVSVKKSSMSGKFTKYAKATILMYLNVRIKFNGSTVVIETYLPNDIAQQKYVQIVPLTGDYYNSNFLLSEGTLEISQSYCQEVEKVFTDNISFIKDKLASYKAKDGDLLWNMSFWNSQKYQTIFDYRCISQVYTAAIRTFPLFRTESYENKKEILLSALKKTKAALLYDGKRSMASSDFSKALYFELVTRHLDLQMATGRFGIKTLSMQKWGREHFGNISRTLLCTEEQIMSFDYTKVSADQLVWVVYDNVNYAAYEMFNMLLPNADDITKNAFNTSVQISDNSDLDDDELEA